MSHHLTNLTWDIELRGMPKLVLLALSHLALQSTGECEPTVRRLAFMCGMSDSGVRAQLVELVRLGHVEEKTIEGRRVYRVHVARQPEGAAV